MRIVFLRIFLLLSTLVQKFKQKKEAARMKKFVAGELLNIQGIEAVTSEKKGTLIVKCDDIGDFMAWQHVIPLIRENAERPITLVANSGIRPLYEAWFEFADHVIWLEKGKWTNEAYRNTIYREVRNRTPRIAFTTLFTRNFKMDDLIVYASQAETRIAWNRKYHPYFPDFSSSDRIFTKFIESQTPIRLEYFRNLEFINSVYGLECDYIFKPLFPDFNKQNRLIVFPAANTRSRWWKAGNYAECIRSVAPYFDSVLLLGGNNAIEYAKSIEQLAAEPKLMNLCGQTSLTELLAFIGESSLLICPDTSAMHFAVHTATDVIVLSNGNNWQRFAGYEPYIPSKYKVLFPVHFTVDINKLKTHYSSAEIQAIEPALLIEAVKQWNQQRV